MIYKYVCTHGIVLYSFTVSGLTVFNTGISVDISAQDDEFTTSVILPEGDYSVTVRTQNIVGLGPEAEAVLFTVTLSK